MNSFDSLRRRQIETMAHPDRLSLLALLISSSSTLSAIDLTSTPSDSGRVNGHLRAMAAAGLLITESSEDSPFGRYRPSADALARFGGAALGYQSRRTGDAEPGDHRRLLDRIAADLAARFAGHVSAETVADFVDESYQLLAARAAVRVYLPTLTERFAADRLEALITATDTERDRRRDVLFVCVRNAGRSQIAAAFARALAGDRLSVRTAGSLPATELDPSVRSELVRRGIAGWVEFPRPLTSEVVQASGVVVTMGCGDACPVVPGRRYVDWTVDDPVGQPQVEVRRIVDDIEGRVRRLVRELDAS
ncbi:arsenate-mycothiol transferase ArsC [Gordonia sp. NPDC003422]